MGIVLGLTAALAFGTADFLAGFASRRTSFLRVIFVSQLAGAAPLLVLLLSFGSGFPTWADVGWGFLAGTSGASGTIFLYRGLAKGPMKVVAPVSAVVSAGVPVLFGLSIGERPGPAALLGITVGLFALVLVSSSRQSWAGPRRLGSSFSESGVTDGLLAGAGFGLFFILIQLPKTGALFWPLIAARISVLTTIGALVLASRTGIRPSKSTAVPILAVGFFDALANVCYVLGVRRGLISVVAVLTSLYPAVTVLLARLVFSERLTSPQAAGLILASAALVLMALA
jgi:drug/metabolite transporter (DMT)-like permease